MDALVKGFADKSGALDLSAMEIGSYLARRSIEDIESQEFTDLKKIAAASASESKSGSPIPVDTVSTIPTDLPTGQPDAGKATQPVSNDHKMRAWAGTVVGATAVVLGAYAFMRVQKNS